MRSDDQRSGYRQPVQARAFGTAMLATSGLAAALFLSVRLFAPPSPPIDAGEMAVFEARSIPLDRSTPPPPEPPQPASSPENASPAPRKATVAPVPVDAPAISAASPIAMALPRPASDLSLPSLSPSIATPVESTAKPDHAASEASAAAAADWRARLLAHLRHYRRYPRQAEAARQQGVVRVAITLRRSGEVTAVELVHGSGYPLLDMAARTTVRRASPLPAVAPSVAGDPVTVEVPIDFALRR